VLRLYPDFLGPRLVRLLLDLLFVLWICAWALVGWEVYQSVLGLEVVANGIADTGHTFNHWVDAFRSTAGGVPVLGSSFRDLADTLQRSAGDPLIGRGAEAHRRIGQLATVLGLVTAIVPIFAAAATYGAWRWRDARRMTSVAAFVQAAERSGRTEEASAVLALRAVATLDYRRLMEASADPVADLAERRYDALASAALKHGGLRRRRLG
jgi:hypothetical protein